MLNNKLKTNYPLVENYTLEKLRLSNTFPYNNQKLLPLGNICDHLRLLEVSLIVTWEGSKGLMSALPGRKGTEGPDPVFNACVWLFGEPMLPTTTLDKFMLSPSNIPSGALFLTAANKYKMFIFHSKCIAIWPSIH